VNLATLAGSPPPTTTTVHVPTLYAFTGSLHLPGRLGHKDHCLLRGRYEGMASLTSLGPSTIAIDFCVVAKSPNFGVDTGEFRIEALDGSVAGPITGGFLEFDGDLQLDLVVDEGTGMYTGAMGSATFVGELDDTVLNGILGELTGSFSA
jgi:hypothetical protein